MIKGLIFDFDGIILDSETTEIIAWKEVYEQFGQIFPEEEYKKAIGSTYNDPMPFINLEKLINTKLDQVQIFDQIRARANDLLENEHTMPGVMEYLDAAKKLNLKLGLASSSKGEWVFHHLDRLEIRHYFDCISVVDDVFKPKPDPELFLLTLNQLNIFGNEAIALEDSFNGVMAAKKAGMIVVAIPNEATSSMNFDAADLVLNSLEDLPLLDLINTF